MAVIGVDVKFLVVLVALVVDDVIVIHALVPLANVVVVPIQF